MANYSLIRRVLSQVAVFSLVGVLMVVFLPCNSYSKPSGKVIVAIQQDITGRGDPLIICGVYMAASSHMFEGLFGFDLKGELVPKLCTSYEISKDGLTYTFHLRKGVKFHNGDPMTAEDIAYLIEHARDPEAKAVSFRMLSKVREVEVVDPYTVKFHLSTPDVFLLNKLAYICAGAIVPKKLMKERGYVWFNQNPVGTGPYKFVSMVTGEKVVMEANESYWGEVPAVKTLELRIIPDKSARVAALKAGEVDVIQLVPQPEIKPIAADPRLKIVSAPNGEPFYLSFNLVNNVNPFLKDVRVRKAFNYAINKEEIIKALLPGSARLSAGIVPASMPWYDPKNLPVMYDPQKAKELLKEANFDFKQVFTFCLSATRYNMGREVALAIADQLAAVGIKLNVKIMEHSQWAYHIRRKKFQDQLTTMTCGHLARTPDVQLENMVYSKGGYSYISIPELDKMIEDLLTVADPAKRLEKTKLVHKKIYDGAYFVFLWELIDSWGMKKNIDFVVTPGVLIPHFETLKINP